MALIIETGAGVENADSYIELLDARTFAANYGLKLSDDDTTAEITLRQAYLHLAIYEPELQGKRTTIEQNNIYPRTGVLSNCVAVDNNLIPESIKQAQVYAAASIQEGYATNNIDNGQALSSFSLDGVISESYQAGSKTKLNNTIQGVQNSIYPLTKIGFYASPCGTGGQNTLSRDDYFYEDC